MGSTSEKLTYLNNTKEKIRDSINLTGANIGTSDTFRSYADKLKKGYIDIINNGIDTLYNNFPKVSGIGSNLSLTPTYEAPMKLNEIQGDTLQDGTPTPNTPVEIQSVTGLQNIEVCGKNLINSVAKSGNRLFFNGGTDAGVGTFKAGTYTISYTSQNTITTYIKNTDGTQTNLGTDKAITFTSNKDFDLWLYRSGITVEEVSNIQLEKGSTTTEYEPYKSNTYEVNLGKNLLNLPDGTYTHNGITAVVSNGKITINGTANGTSFIGINVGLSLQKGNYVLSNNNSKTINDDSTYIRFDSDGNTICTFLAQNVSKAITLSSNTNYSQLVIRTTSGITFDNFEIYPQLEKGSQATSYSPYFTPIELNKIGDYQDKIYKDNGKWYVEKQIGKVVLDGTEDWTLNNNYTNNSRFTNNDDILNKSERNVLSNYFVKGTGGTDTTNIDVNGVRGKIMLTIPNSIATSVSNLTTWLSTHNTEVLYVLVTPEYTEITNTELIEDLETLYTAKSQEGTTNISITSEDLEMILNISALKGEV